MKTICELRVQLEAEIETRRNLQREMVGKLYPTILEHEIKKLGNALQQLIEH